jgi:hypothetical protein
MTKFYEKGTSFVFSRSQFRLSFRKYNILIEGYCEFLQLLQLNPGRSEISGSCVGE